MVRHTSLMSSMHCLFRHIVARLRCSFSGVTLAHHHFVLAQSLSADSPLPHDSGEEETWNFQHVYRPKADFHQAGNLHCATRYVITMLLY